MIRFLAQISGPDQAGLLQRYAAQTHQRGGKWLSSKVIRLDGRFAALLRIELPADQVAGLQQALASIEGYEVSFFDPPSEAEMHYRSLHLLVDAADRPGLVNDITDVLQDYQVKIADMESQRVSVVELGGNVFRAQFELLVPGGAELVSMVRDLEALGERVKVDLQEAANAH